MTKRPPGVMVSSTFYDLRQIRADLASFIADSLHYRPLLSELSSFPIEPDVDTVENCRRRVEQDADVLVLVIGGRYGSIDSKTAKSVTNLEYLAARSKGVPIYVFVDKRVLALVPVWQKSPNADFSGVVDDPRVFEFIDQIRSVDKVWTHEFENAQDIVETLHIQLAYLMTEGLQWQLRMGSARTGILGILKGQSLRLALEKPPAWEYYLFIQALNDEITACSDLKREHDLELKLGVSDSVQLKDFGPWSQARLTEITGMANTLDKLLNSAAMQAFGPPGTPGDIEAIVFVAQRIGAVYREALDWSQKLRRATVDNRVVSVLTEMANFTQGIIAKIEQFPKDFSQQLEDGLREGTKELPKQIRINLVLDAPTNMAQFEKKVSEALAELTKSRE